MVGAQNSSKKVGIEDEVLPLVFFLSNISAKRCKNRDNLWSNVVLVKLRRFGQNPTSNGFATLGAFRV